MNDAPTPDELAAALEMIDLGTWGARARIFALIAHTAAADPTGTAKLGYRDVATRAHVGERWAHKLLRALVRERVLKRVERGAGHRATRWAINPDVIAWRGVPWLGDVELAYYRTRARHLAVVPRSHGAALKPVVPRSHGAALDPVVPRHGGAALDPVVPRHGGAALDPPGAAGHLFSRETTSLCDEDREREWEAIRALIAERTGTDTFGKPEETVRQLLAAHGCEQVRAWVLEIDPAGMRSPLFVRALARRASTEDPTARAAARGEQLRREIAHIEGLIASGALDADDPIYGTRLAECHNELASLGEEGAA